MTPEKQLIEAAQADKTQFIALYDLHFEKIYKFLLSRVADRALAEDLTSETFTIALDKIDSYTYTGKPFSAWLYRIAINEMNKHYNKNKKEWSAMEAQWHERAENFDSADLDLKKGEDAEEELSQLQMLTGALEHLKPNERDLISLRYFENLSYAEIADILETNTNNIGVKINRALKRLNQLCNFQTHEA